MRNPNKKRYQVTLTVATVEKFQKLAQEINLPFGSMSSILDDSLEKVTETISRLQSKGSCNFADLLQMVGEQLDEIQKEAVNDKEKTVEVQSQEDWRKKAKNK